MSRLCTVSFRRLRRSNPQRAAGANASGSTPDAWPEKKTGNIVWERELPAGVQQLPDDLHGQRKAVNTGCGVGPPISG